MVVLVIIVRQWKFNCRKWVDVEGPLPFFVVCCQFSNLANLAGLATSQKSKAIHLHARLKATSSTPASLFYRLSGI